MTAKPNNNNKSSDVKLNLGEESESEIIMPRVINIDNPVETIDVIYNNRKYSIDILDKLSIYELNTIVNNMVKNGKLIQFKIPSKKNELIDTIRIMNSGIYLGEGFSSRIDNYEYSIGCGQLLISLISLFFLAMMLSAAFILGFYVAGI